MKEGVFQPVERQKALIESLSRGRGYDHPVEDLQVLDTHISWVVLTGDIAYKIKKPVKLEFLDYSTLEKRKHCCELELELNRRWAPDIYLDVVPISGSFEAPEVGGAGTPIEFALKMNQFPQSSQLDEQLEAGLLRVDDMIDLAETVARIHAAVPVYEAVTGDAFFEAIRDAMIDNFEFLQEGTDADEIKTRLRARMSRRPVPQEPGSSAVGHRALRLRRVQRRAAQYRCHQRHQLPGYGPHGPGRDTARLRLH